MKLAFVISICGACVCCGCAGNRAYRPAAPASTPSASPGIFSGSGGSDSSSDMGSPSNSFPSQSSSSFPPSSNKKSSAPILGPRLPAAKKSEMQLGDARGSVQHAPDPAGSSPQPPTEVRTQNVSGFERPVIVDGSTWNTFYRSSDRRPIKSAVLGNGPRRIAIMGSLHGDEPQSVGLVDELHRCLRQNPEYLKQVTVLLVKSPNPDGNALGTAFNSRGVDLNHNFPTPNWKALDGERAGAKSGSEAETKAVVRLLTDFKPHLMVHVKDSRSTGFVNFEGGAKYQAEQIAGLIDCQVMQGRGEKTSGSVESYALNRLSCPNLTLLLPRETGHDEAWNVNGAALLSLLESPKKSGELAGSNPRGNSIREQPDPFDDARSKGPRKNQLPARQTSRTEHKPLPDFPLPVPETGYLELPPP